MTSSRTTRVVQWTTGNVGRRSVLAICANPELELVGCYAWSRDKVGQRRGRALWARRASGSPRDERPRRAPGPPPRLRRLQPKVARRRRTRRHPRGRCRRRDDRGVHHGRRARLRPRQGPRRLRPWTEFDLRFGHESRSGQPPRRRVGEHLRPHRRHHDHRVRRFHRLRLARDRAPGRIRPTARRSGTACDDRVRHGGLWRRRAPRGRCARARAGRRRVRGRIRPDDPRPGPRHMVDSGGPCLRAYPSAGKDGGPAGL